MKPKKNVANIFLAISLVLSLCLLVWMGYVSTFYYQEFNRITKLIQETPETPLYERIAQNLYAERPYDINDYNCYNMSLELQRRLTAEGYDALMRCGDYYDTNGTFVSGHCWIELTLKMESTNSLILDPSQYKQYRS